MGFPSSKLAVELSYQNQVTQIVSMCSLTPKKRLDALHLATAEALNVDVLLTTDDQLLRRAVQHSTHLTISVLNPVQFSTT